MQDAGTGMIVKKQEGPRRQDTVESGTSFSTVIMSAVGTPRASSTSDVSRRLQRGSTKSSLASWNTFGGARSDGSYSSEVRTRSGIFEDSRMTKKPTKWSSLEAGEGEDSQNSWIAEVTRTGKHVQLSSELWGENCTLKTLVRSGKQIEFLARGTKKNMALFVEIPDPPCVMHPEWDSADHASEAARLGKVQEYWKKYSDWMDVWPNLRPRKEAVEKFLAEWTTLTAPAAGSSPTRAFVVVCPQPVAVRKTASMDSEKTDRVLQPGEPVMVEAIVEGKGGASFLELTKGGFVFTTKDNMTVMAEITNIETGSWWYRVACSKCIDVRKTPSYDLKCRTGLLLCPSELATVNLRCRVKNHSFVHLGDGRGWVFCKRPGCAPNDFHASSIVFDECDHEVLDGKAEVDYRYLIPPTEDVVEVGEWMYRVEDEPVLAIGSTLNGTFLHPGDIVEVDKRAYASGNINDKGGRTIKSRLWLRLVQRQGWVPAKSLDGMDLLTQYSGIAVDRPTAIFRKSLDTPEEEWMAGIA